jgi:hypothetical protein
MDVDKYEIKSKWQYPNYLYSKQIDSTLHDYNVKKSLKQMQLLKNMEMMKKSNLKRHKLNSDETNILKNMSINNFSSQLRFNDIIIVVKKEIWKLAMTEVKKLKSSIQAKNAKQILFYYRFGSLNKRKKKNFLSQISNHLLIMLYDFDNSPNKKLNEEYDEGFQIPGQFQIKELFRCEIDQSKISDFRNQT